jgi:hypothetical protein
LSSNARRQGDFDFDFDFDFGFGSGFGSGRLYPRIRRLGRQVGRQGGWLDRRAGGLAYKLRCYDYDRMGMGDTIH